MSLKGDMGWRLFFLPFFALQPWSEWFWPLLTPYDGLQASLGLKPLESWLRHFLFVSWTCHVFPYSNGKLAWFDKKLKMSIPVETKVNTIQSKIPPNTESVFYIVNNMEYSSPISISIVSIKINGFIAKLHKFM